MVIVTGGAGFIGSNIVKALNERGCSDILIVDNLSDGTKIKNISDCKIYDYLDKDDFIERIKAGNDFYVSAEAVFHEGACSSTTNWDGRYMMRNNYEYSKELLHYCLKHRIPYLYASSASVYGDGTVFKEALEYEKTLNVYGYSKFLFDQYVRRVLPDADSQIAGFRYFNVYGPCEQHKGSMASVAFHFNNQVLAEGKVKLFEGSDGYTDGEQRRDFVYVSDVVEVNLWFMENPDKSGIFNVGTGRSRTFNDVARGVIAFHGRGDMEYIPFPDHLKNRYQSFTEADIAQLREAGCPVSFKTVEQGVQCYMECLNA